MEKLTYEEFIQNILYTRGRFACGDEYHERHHIIPKCMDGSDDDENLIDLFAKEHFIAHKLLAEENPNNRSLIYAWWCMSHIKGNEYQELYELSPEEYEEARKTWVQAIRGENHPMYGKHHSEETKQKISEANSNPSEETREKIRRAAQQRTGDKNGMFGKKHMNKTKEKIRAYALNRPEEVNEKISMSLIGKFAGEANPNYGKTGELSSWWGKNHTEETKQKQREAHIGEKNPAARRIIRLCDLKIYGTRKYAAEDNGVSPTQMGRYCKVQRDFMYYDEWLKLQNELEESDEL